MLDSKKSKMSTVEVFLDNFKGCADSCARSLLRYMQWQSHTRAKH
ncbi:glutamyl-tRNA synthetase [Helicobacter cinaedi]|nr:glutamyl-tRNA synthetase [Helicobacter cinaedi]